jgi:hypothetical protein
MPGESQFSRGFAGKFLLTIRGSETIFHGVLNRLSLPTRPESRLDQPRRHDISKSFISPTVRADALYIAPAGQARLAL